MPSFWEMSIGDCATIEHVITEHDLERFVALTGDDNRLHMDPSFAQSTSFRGRVVHGMLGASFISTVIGTKIPGDGALWYSQTLEFISPVRVGDRIRVVATVVEMIPRDSVVVLQTDIFNQDKQKVTTGIARVKVVEPSEALSPPLPSPLSRTALVIGGTGGVGEAVVRRLAARGHQVLLTCHAKAEKAESLCRELNLAGGRVLMAQGDICSSDFIVDLRDRCKRHFRTLDYVVNTATGPIASAALADLEWRDLERHLLVNLKSSFELAKLLSPLMMGRVGAGFVFITSMAAESPVSGWLPYVTAKAGLSGLARSLAIEFAPIGVRANLVSPGMIDTNLIASIPERMRLLIEAKTPRRRIATPADVAGAVEYLCSEAGEYLTGETIRINGGQMMV